MPRMRWRSGLDVLREREFRLVFGAQVVSLFGDGVVPVALAFAVLDLTGSASDLGLVLAARTLPLIACLLAGGVVAERRSCSTRSATPRAQRCWRACTWSRRRAAATARSSPACARAGPR